MCFVCGVFISFVGSIIYLICGTVKGENEYFSLFLGMKFIPNNRYKSIPIKRYAGLANGLKA
jgi:hypothetical protein